MTKYMVEFKEITIGLLEVDEEKNLYKYTINRKNIESVKDGLILPVDLSTSTDWVNPIPFFSNRIKNVTRINPDATIIGYHTDNYRLIKL